MNIIYAANQLPLYLKSTEMDFLTIIEEFGYRPPIAFKSWAQLEHWLQGNPELEVHRLGTRRLTNVRLVSGKISLPGCETQLFYSQLWVKASYSAYRKAILEFVEKSEQFNSPIKTHDVDHMVSSTWLKKHWGKGAVVNVAFSEKSINQRVGSLIERGLASPSKDIDVVHLNAAAIAKIFYNDDDSTADIEKVLQKSFSRFLKHDRATSLLNSIGQELVPNFARQVI